MLEEYGLDTTLLFSATSDAGSDVKPLCDVLLPGLWEWCVCHMVNCVLVEVSLRWFSFLLRFGATCVVCKYGVLGDRFL